ncbi:hypothetical protein RUM44_007326 [Polyplax serrata]|uniref:Uncharacterized protein n=1 Tax=Polyplax serrata TaxID=468196 RepID=A0ABR1B0C8_POLSC
MEKLRERFNDSEREVLKAQLINSRGDERKKVEKGKRADGSTITKSNYVVENYKKWSWQKSEQVEEDDDFIFPKGVQLSDWRNVKELQRPLDCSICIAKERNIITQRNYSKVLEEESQVKKRMKS